MEYIVKTSWFVIDPATKKHCVADCLALTQILRSDKQLTSVWGYVKKVGQKIADENNICDGATV